MPSGETAIYNRSTPEHEINPANRRRLTTDALPAMDSERRQRINELCAAAAERAPAERSDFLAAACGDDAALRREVESRLGAREQAPAFIETPTFRFPGVRKPDAAEQAEEAEEEVETHLTPGARLGPYEIVALLGEGGMGQVYLAHDPRLGREVAIKVLSRHTPADRAQLARFEQEARAASALNHPNLLAVFDVGDQGGIPYVVTELLEGETLEARLQRGPLPLREGLECARQIAAGLAAAHEKGIVHRDLKPANVFLTRDARAKILDFGLAKRTALAGAAGLASGATRPGMVVGSLGFMSPEQVRGQPLDPRSDLFSFGAVLYEMLSGCRAFTGPSAVETLSAILTEEPPDLSRIAGAVPPAVERLVHACLRKGREERVQSAAELSAVLAELLRMPEVGSAAPAREGSVDTARKSGGLAAVAGESASELPGEAQSVRPAGERQQLTQRRGMKVTAILAAAAALVLGSLAVWRLWPDAKTSSGRVMLAVLPVQNLTGDPKQEYISDGLTEELIGQLGGLNAQQLGVIARASAMSYKGTHKKADQIGHELGVDYILESSLRGTGRRIRATAQLVRVRDQTHVWSQSYDRTMSDVVALQTDVAHAIAGKIQVQFTSPAAAPRAKPRRVDPDAYLAYLQGRYHWNKRSREMLLKSIEDFQQAIRLDPAYPQAYAGLADSYLSLVLIAEPRPAELLVRARAAALEALRLDDSMAEAHTSLAYAKFYYDWDWPGAEAEFRRAIVLNPGYATAHQWYAEFLGSMGRQQEAIAEGKKALELDPLSLIINMEAGLPYLHFRRYDAAIGHFRKTIELDPNFALAHCNLGIAYAEKGESRKAIEELEEALRLDSTAAIVSFLAQVYAEAGRRTDAERLLGQLQRQVEAKQVSPYFLARIYVALHEDGKALDALEQAYAEHHWGMARIFLARSLEPLRSKPRFTDLLRRMNFPLQRSE
ncbi:MAG TPA: protein kinase [Thermoanaerobaculia bacterium]|nr:protein kinase [Thermoanaerobaculia bacterium]